MDIDKAFGKLYEEVKIDEAKEFWAIIDKAKGGEVMAVTSDEKGAKSSVKMSNFSKHDYHFGKDPRTLKIVKVAGSYKQGEKMIGTKLSFKEDIEKEASTYRKPVFSRRKRNTFFGGKKKSRHGESGYGKGEEVDRKFTEAFGLDERKMTDAEMAEREEIVKKLKPKLQSFKDKYGDDAKSVMYATATKQAMEEVVIESTKEYAKSLEKIARDKQMSMISKSDKDKLLKIAALLDKERKEETDIQESGHTDVASMKTQVQIATDALQKMNTELGKLSDEEDLPTWWTNKVAIAVDKLDGMADYLGTQVEEEFKPHKMYDPKTGKEYDADTVEDHLKYKKMGYSHEKPQVEALEKEGAAEFMAAASAAKKEGKKKFKFGGKEYPVTIKVDIPLANEEIANSVGGGGIAGLDIGLTAKKKKEDTDKAKALRKKMVGEEVQRTTFAGKDVFIVDSDTYYNCRLGKKKYGRYEKYVGDGEVGQTIREYGLKYPRRPIILQNGESGPMLYLKYGRS